MFPELCTLPTLLLAAKLLDACEAIDALTDYTPRFEALVTVLSVRHRINVIGATRVTRVASGAISVAYAAL